MCMTITIFLISRFLAFPIYEGRSITHLFGVFYLTSLRARLSQLIVLALFRISEQDDRCFTWSFASFPSNGKTIVKKIPLHTVLI